MLVALLFATTIQAPTPSMLGKDRPRERALEPGDVVRVDTGIPNTGIPAIRLWKFAGEGEDRGLTKHEIEYWAFCASMGTAEPLEQVHFMADRMAVDLCPTGWKVRIVAIHRDWGFGVLDGVPVAEVEIAGPTGEFGPMPEPGQRIPFTNAIPLPYLSDPARPDPMLHSLPILRRTAERHRHRHCTVEPGDRHGDHVDAVLYADAQEQYREKRRRARELERKAKAEARRRGDR